MAKNKLEVLSAFDTFVYVGKAVSGYKPASAIDAIPLDYKELGLVLQDPGFVITRTNTQTDVMAANRGPARTLITEGKSQLAFTSLQTNADIMEESTGRKLNAETSAFHTDSAFMGGIKSAIVDAFDEEMGQKLRWFFPEIKLVEVGDLTISDNGVLSYPFTYTAYPVIIGGESTEYMTFPAVAIPED